jgi:hypothetical protein
MRWRLADALKLDLDAAEAALRGSETDKQHGRYVERLRFTRASFDMIETYLATVTAVASPADYGAAVAAGNRALDAQKALKTASTLFVSGIVGGRGRVSWLAGEVDQYAALRALTDGSKGRLVAPLPKIWQFKVEQPLSPSWRYDDPEPRAPANDSPFTRETASAMNGWRPVRSDLYLQGQGILAEDGQSHLGHFWYRTTISGGAVDQTGKLRLMFPGLFNEAWLYVNGTLVAHRAYQEPWWRTDYRFEWDVDITGLLRAGDNEIAVRQFNPHHFGGMFRRPFLYHPN